ncbi:MAG: 50S ribosomal protein L4 [Bacteroidia bacterium]|nr:50S ribosomal protein L4 [Bacteroidia bacterium]
MELPVYSVQGKTTGASIVLEDSIFAIEPNDHAIYLDVRMLQANQRRGTHKTKDRSEVRGSTKKPFKQKGTGNARQGQRRSPLFKGGGTIFGPRPRDYSFSINKKVKKLARKSALTYKARESKIIIVESFSIEKPKTKDFIKILKNFNLESSKVLLILPSQNKNVHLSARNISTAQVQPALQFTTIDVLHCDQLIIVKDAVNQLNTLLA